LLAFLDGFVQHDGNTFMDDGAGGTAHPGGDNHMTNAGHMFIYLPYCIYCLAGSNFQCN
jgi:hypothetical protein